MSKKCQFNVFYYIHKNPSKLNIISFSILFDNHSLHQLKTFRFWSTSNISLRACVAVRGHKEATKAETHECFNMTSPAVTTNYNAISRIRMCEKISGPAECVRARRFVRQR